MSKHTPGPWEIHKAQNGRTIVQVGPCAPEEYAGCAWLDVSEPDACLIAAAPDLLEALEAVVRVADRATVEFDMARAAIAKARGEP
ncbi:hypothetical protein [Ectopseudomonas alcaliphila]|uniref:Uncharacterized protein n=1 Tax=Ectopseudomonas alcaliphila TaxID=101564 RepID=A0A1G7JDI8_9GAMM|nr:hypothetical protein [Pseudomonas alcaliphila]MDX5990447.1 hypothetical protein [Pseudomonas alcaliphila]MDX5995417.1 hypothetical protein [Pseudomonas alcaliphila]MDX5995462.1 hypothetical protein [Pseudomonas alcaliphila]SDF22953.1 hypothetical protein SAMN05216575_106197 [Pseudomonas alcaliphila]